MTNDSKNTNTTSIPSASNNVVEGALVSWAIAKHHNTPISLLHFQVIFAIIYRRENFRTMLNSTSIDDYYRRRPTEANRIRHTYAHTSHVTHLSLSVALSTRLLLRTVREDDAIPYFMTNSHEDQSSANVLTSISSKNRNPGLHTRVNVATHVSNWLHDLSFVDIIHHTMLR